METLDKLRADFEAMRGCAHITDLLMACVIKRCPQEAIQGMLSDFLEQTEESTVTGMFSPETSEAFFSAMREHRTTWIALLAVAAEQGD
jgi:hypothetical protein